MQNVVLYHGSDIIVQKPNLYAGMPKHDFGRAFYLTSSQEQATRWSTHKIVRHAAVSQKARYNYLVSKFFFDKANENKLKVKVFDTPDKNWLNYVMKNRKDIEFAMRDDYDLVIGPVMDGTKSWITLKLYSQRKISFDEAIKRIKPENLKDQWAFKTQKAINLLNYGGVLYESK